MSPTALLASSLLSADANAAIVWRATKATNKKEKYLNENISTECLHDSLQLNDSVFFLFSFLVRFMFRFGIFTGHNWTLLQFALMLKY